MVDCRRWKTHWYAELFLVNESWNATMAYSTISINFLISTTGLRHIHLDWDSGNQASRKRMEWPKLLFEDHQGCQVDWSAWHEHAEVGTRKPVAKQKVQHLWRAALAVDYGNDFDRMWGDRPLQWQTTLRAQVQRYRTGESEGVLGLSYTWRQGNA